MPINGIFVLLKCLLNVNHYAVECINHITHILDQIELRRMIFTETLSNNDRRIARIIFLTSIIFKQIQHGIFVPVLLLHCS